MRILVNFSQFLSAEFQSLQSSQRVFKLCDRTCPDERRGDARITQRPGNSHLGQSLSATLRNGVQCADATQQFFVLCAGFQRAALIRPRSLRNAVQIA